MITKKIAVPLINEKILLQAQHCYIATAGISDAGFDFIRSRIPGNCKIDMVTGLDELSSPGVLQRIFRHYQGRITLNIYARNVLHANVYIFDLPYRKSIAFVGSGNCTLEGLKDHEELFWKVTDPKEIESLMSWFTGYFEFGVPLTEEVIREYELIYPAMQQRAIESRLDRQQFLALAASGFNLDAIKFKNQYFKKEDYFTLSTENAALDTDAIRTSRTSLQQKLYQLHDALKDKGLTLSLNRYRNVVTSVEMAGHSDKKIRSLWISYKQDEGESPVEFITLQAGISATSFSVRINVDMQHCSPKEKERFSHQVQDDTYRAGFFEAFSHLEKGYTIEVNGFRKSTDFFQKEQALWEFIKSDYGMNQGFIIEKKFSPGDPMISNDNIVSSVLSEFAKLLPVYVRCSKFEV
jgi:hypothetical protein